MEDELDVNGCVYECSLCIKTVDAKTKMRRHLDEHVAEKMITKRDIKKLLVETRTVTLYHQCVFCKAKVIRDYSTINSHVRQKHGLTVSTYKKLMANSMKRKQSN